MHSQYILQSILIDKNESKLTDAITWLLNEYPQSFRLDTIDENEKHFIMKQRIWYLFSVLQQYYVPNACTREGLTLISLNEIFCVSSEVFRCTLIDPQHKLMSEHLLLKHTFIMNTSNETIKVKELVNRTIYSDSMI